ncbi:hypothetical protein ACJX0J_023742, partial [Zea mays]
MLIETREKGYCDVPVTIHELVCQHMGFDIGHTVGRSTSQQGIPNRANKGIGQIWSFD